MTSDTSSQTFTRPRWVIPLYIIGTFLSTLGLVVLTVTVLFLTKTLNRSYFYYSDGPILWPIVLVADVWVVIPLITCYRAIVSQIYTTEMFVLTIVLSATNFAIGMSVGILMNVLSPLTAASTPFITIGQLVIMIIASIRLHKVKKSIKDFELSYYFKSSEPTIPSRILSTSGSIAVVVAVGFIASAKGTNMFKVFAAIWMLLPCIPSLISAWKNRSNIAFPILTIISSCACLALTFIFFLIYSIIYTYYEYQWRILGALALFLVGHMATLTSGVWEYQRVRRDAEHISSPLNGLFNEPSRTNFFLAIAGAILTLASFLTMIILNRSRDALMSQRVYLDGSGYVAYLSILMIGYVLGMITSVTAIISSSIKQSRYLYLVPVSVFACISVIISLSITISTTYFGLSSYDYYYSRIAKWSHPLFIGLIGQGLSFAVILLELSRLAKITPLFQIHLGEESIEILRKRNLIISIVGLVSTFLSLIFLWVPVTVLMGWVSVLILIGPAVYLLVIPSLLVASARMKDPTAGRGIAAIVLASLAIAGCFICIILLGFFVDSARQNNSYYYDYYYDGTYFRCLVASTAAVATIVVVQILCIVVGERERRRAIAFSFLQYSEMDETRRSTRENIELPEI